MSVYDFHVGINLEIGPFLTLYLVLLVAAVNACNNF